MAERKVSWEKIARDIEKELRGDYILKIHSDEKVAGLYWPGKGKEDINVDGNAEKVTIYKRGCGLRYFDIYAMVKKIVSKQVSGVTEKDLEDKDNPGIELYFSEKGLRWGQIEIP